MSVAFTHPRHKVVDCAGNFLHGQVALVSEHAYYFGLEDAREFRFVFIRGTTVASSCTTGQNRPRMGPAMRGSSRLAPLRLNIGDANG